jgi:hypothetical protein
VNLTATRIRAIINLEDTYVHQSQNPLSCGLFMPEQLMEVQLDTKLEDEVCPTYFDSKRPCDWVGRDRELMQPLDAPGCYITKPAPAAE